MNWLSNIKMRHKLLLLLLLPCLVLLILSTFTIIRNYQELNANRQVDAWGALLYKLDDVVDNVDQEKEYSLLLIDTGSKLTASKLLEIRQSVDDGILALKDELTNLNWSIESTPLKNAFQKIIDKLDNLSTKRNQIDTLSTVSPEIKFFFENINRSFNEIIGNMIQNTDLSWFSQKLQSYLDIRNEALETFNEKEIIETFLAKNQITTQTFIQLVSAIKGQEIASQNFVDLATPANRNLYKNLFRNNLNNDLNRFRLPILEKNSLQPTINLQEWTDALSTKIQKLKEVRVELIKQIDTATDETIKNDSLNLFALLITLLLLGIITYWITSAIIKSIVKALESGVKVAQEVSQGNLSPSLVNSTRKDELGDLERALQKMIFDLRSMNKKLQEEVDVLATSSSEILASITQVSSGTSETAAAVSETTTTVEELKQTSQISTEKAHDVLTNTEHALETLKMSEKSLDATIDDMQQIQNRMSTISQSIIKLSEHSQAIGKIIDTVNDLAEQSNLLAVNAAIEAAKASEQGKGFAIVAQEVRSLAEQSKEATVQVYTILNDIQNATSSAVMATEQGAKAVALGVDRSSQTNEALRSLSDGIDQVIQSAQQIAISNQQQLVGVGQVNIAMSNIKEASNQHVDHMQQIKTAVNNLNNVGQSLKSLVEKYNL